MSRSTTRTRLVLEEELDELDLQASKELEGLDDEDNNLENDLNQIETDLDSGLDEPNKINKNNNEYGLKNVSDQLDGMIKQWFKLTQNLPAEKKEPFLKLGDRLSEITEVLKVEFLNA